MTAPKNIRFLSETPSGIAPRLCLPENLRSFLQVFPKMHVLTPGSFPEMYGKCRQQMLPKIYAMRPSIIR